MREALGDEEAETLMEHLPPLGWADVATKQDLAHLATVMRGEIALLGAGLRGDMSELRADLFREQRNQTYTLVSALAALMAVMLAVLRFT